MYLAQRFSVLKSFMDRRDVNSEGRLAHDKQQATHIPIYSKDGIWTRRTTIQIMEAFPTETMRGIFRRVMYFAFSYQDTDSVPQVVDEGDSSRSKGKRTPPSLFKDRVRSRAIHIYSTSRMTAETMGTMIMTSTILIILVTTMILILNPTLMMTVRLWNV